MQIGSVNSQDYGYQTTLRKQTESTTTAYSSAVTKVETTGKGKFLGMTMVPEEGKSIIYGMTANLLEESTADKPIVQIVSGLDGKTEIFNIDVSQVDPQNATRMEMFALCEYADSIGQGTGSTFGSYQTLEIYGETAKINGCTKQVNISESAWEQFRTEKLDWIEQTKQVCDILQKCTDSKALDLFSKGKKLLHMFEKHMNRYSILNNDIWNTMSTSSTITVQ